MKRVLMALMLILLVFSLTGCGGTAGNEPPQSGQVDAGAAEESGAAGQTGQPEQTQQPPQAEEPAQADGEGIICDNYRAFFDAKGEFNDYVLEQSEGHEIVSVNLPLATVFELHIFDYLLPLEFMGESIKTLGKYDPDFELVMFQQVCADDVEVFYDEDTGYELKYTDTQGSKVEIKAKYDGDADSLRLEAYKDGVPVLMFEFIKTAGGYAAQYHFETVVRYEMATPIVGLCTYRTIFEESNGSCARFDNVTSEPESIFGKAPDAAAFIEGATHWFSVTNGNFTGNLGGETF